MILPETNYNHVNGVWAGRGISSGRNGSAGGENEVMFRIPETPKEEDKKDPGSVSAQEEFYKNRGNGVEIPIGSMCMTQEEWEKMLGKFDEAQQEIKEELAKEKEARDFDRDPDEYHPEYK